MASVARHFPILTFHELADDGAAISTSPALFERGMARLHGAGFRTLDLTSAADSIRRGGQFPDRHLSITFDDGYESVYRWALPVLQRFGFTATVFVTVGEQPTSAPGARLPSLEGRTPLDWSQIREMRRAGIQFGAHTLTHPDLTQLPQDRLEAEMVGSKKILEDALSCPVRSFAYPFGRHDVRSREVARQHFECACSDALGFTSAASDLHTLERLDAYYLRRPRCYGLMGSPLLRWQIRARSVPRRLRRRARSFR